MLKKNILIWYKPELVAQARELRNNPTEAESILWERLKGNQIKGYDFHRQKPLLFFIVDFYCTPLRLAIELDGEVHLKEEVSIRDQSRQELLGEYGVQIIRFSNDEVISECSEVVMTIEKWIDNYLGSK